MSVGLEIPGFRSAAAAERLIDRATVLLDRGWRELLRATWDREAKAERVPGGARVLQEYRRYWGWYQEIRLEEQSGQLSSVIEERADQLAEWARVYEQVRAEVDPEQALPPMSGPTLIPSRSSGETSSEWLSRLARGDGPSWSIGLGGVLLGAAGLALLLHLTRRSNGAT